MKSFGRTLMPISTNSTGTRQPSCAQLSPVVPKFGLSAVSAGPIATPTALILVSQNEKTTSVGFTKVIFS
jgi:hypothetical protein